MSGYDYKITEVLKVVDGDTVDLRVDVGFKQFADLRFRVLGIDTPERGEPGWSECTMYTKGWLDARPKHIRITTYKPDNFGRWLAVVYDAETGKTLSMSLLAYMRSEGWLR